MEIREATAEDVPAVREVAEEAWWAAYAGFLEPGQIRRGLDELYDPEFLERAIEEAEALEFLVAEVDGEVVGFASAELTWADEAELFTLYVHPDHWEEGVGSALLETVEEWAREAGADRLACSVFTENYAGVPFFESRGFERLGEVPTEIAGSTHEEYELEKRL